MKKSIFKRIIAAVCCVSMLAVTACDVKPGEPQGPYPVIVIPGIMGTELKNSEGRTVWPAQNDGSVAGVLTFVSDFLSLKLGDTAESDGSLSPVRFSPMTEYSEGDDVGTYGVYTKLALALSEDLGYENVYFFGYDWRLDNKATAEELSAYIADVLETTGAKKVNIVAHSMGGLVTSAYLDAHKSEALIDRAVTCGTPFLGAQDAYTTLNSGNGFLDFDTETYGQFMPGILDLFTSIPALYQLMPGPGWSEMALVDENGALKEGATAAQTKGHAFYTDITSRMDEIWQGTAHINIVGKSYKTAGEKGEEDGDGTVTLYSATADGRFTQGSHSLTEFDLSHNDLVTDDAAVAAVISAVGKSAYSRE